MRDAQQRCAPRPRPIAPLRCRPLRQRQRAQLRQRLLLPERRRGRPIARRVHARPILAPAAVPIGCSALRPAPPATALPPALQAHAQANLVHSPSLEWPYPFMFKMLILPGLLISVMHGGMHHRLLRNACAAPCAICWTGALDNGLCQGQARTCCRCWSSSENSSMEEPAAPSPTRPAAPSSSPLSSSSSLSLPLASSPSSSSKCSRSSCFCRLLTSACAPCTDRILYRRVVSHATFFVLSNHKKNLNLGGSNSRQLPRALTNAEAYAWAQGHIMDS